MLYPGIRNRKCQSIVRASLFRASRKCACTRHKGAFASHKGAFASHKGAFAVHKGAFAVHKGVFPIETGAFIGRTGGCNGFTGGRGPGSSAPPGLPAGCGAAPRYPSGSFSDRTKSLFIREHGVSERENRGAELKVRVLEQAHFQFEAGSLFGNVFREAARSLDFRIFKEV
jgi:hypothetical protein